MSFLWPGRGGPAIDYISGPPGESFRNQKKRNLVVLGSTGSIGCNALDVVEQTPELFHVTAIACATSIPKMRSQALRHRPPFLAVLNTETAAKLRSMLPPDYNPQILWGPEGYARLASLPEADLVVCAQMGSAGLVGAMSAALSGKTLALANKESLVIAGSLIRRICADTGAAILPVDSEHFALFQCIAGKGQAVHSLILTASGGPFRGKTMEQLQTMTCKDALKHPNWQMGAKITIDSATLMNKGLEFIEALHLYGISPDNLQILIHPQSVVHSLARMKDNSVIAQLADPDMRLPIGACMAWPDDTHAYIKTLDLAALGILTFEKPDLANFPCLGLALRAAMYSPDQAWSATGLNPACIILNAANEVAVSLFLDGKCGFCDIPVLIQRSLDNLLEHLEPPTALNIDNDPVKKTMQLAGIIMRLDHETRNFTHDLAKKSGMECS